jgi:hypothetical protein
MDLDIHKYSSTTQHWTNGRLTQDKHISNYECCTLTFDANEKDCMDALGIYLKSKNFIEGTHFKFTILSGEMSDGKTYFVIETNNQMCKNDYNEIRVIFEKLKNTGRFN